MFKFIWVNNYFHNLQCYFNLYSLFYPNFIKFNTTLYFWERKIFGLVFDLNHFFSYDIDFQTSGVKYLLFDTRFLSHNVVFLSFQHIWDRGSMVTWHGIPSNELVASRQHLKDLEDLVDIGHPVPAGAVVQLESQRGSSHGHLQHVEVTVVLLDHLHTVVRCSLGLLFHTFTLTANSTLRANLQQVLDRKRVPWKFNIRSILF